MSELEIILEVKNLCWVCLVVGFEEEWKMDKDKARRVIETIKAGVEQIEPVLPQIDNPHIQFQIFKSEMLKAEFAHLDPEVQQALRTHAGELFQLIQREQQQAMEAAMVAKGGGEQADQALAGTGAMPQGAPTAMMQ